MKRRRQKSQYVGFFGFLGFLSLRYFFTHDVTDLYSIMYFAFFAYFLVGRLVLEMRLIWQMNARQVSLWDFWQCLLWRSFI